MFAGAIMISVFTAMTPNGIKVPIALEELGVPYHLILVDLAVGEQHRPAFLARNPNGKIPVLHDPEGPDGQPYDLSESGAILLYLADKYQGLLPNNAAERWRAIESLLLQVSSVGPSFGQAHWFLHVAPVALPAAMARFRNEALRLTQLLEARLEQSPWLAGEEYSIADIMHFSWLRAADYADIALDQYPRLRAWLERINARPAVQRALARIKQAQDAADAAVEDISPDQDDELTNPHAQFCALPIRMETTP